ncbi:hypothetical protein [Chamaesiphon polymorphus]|uniref:Uncharacterized protein n=1 Tax=Chamaesiphon polymorphus CCALA 037 TaxID=2107692 RepID=A0A2T1GH96_9CYAN|nr:hypothetical protein [Chamaesiphon polymorphus]PSB56984.1 hypothetical protein C7B77_09965 [Chamaesiphon polymorphus CCALA 037]
MKTSQYLSVIMSIGALWISIGSRSTIQGFGVESAIANSAVGMSVDRQPQLLAQKNNVASNPSQSDAERDFRVQEITVTRNSSDKSLLTVKWSIENQSQQPHYVYYIVAKFISNDVSIKQAIVPVNITIPAGKSTSFTHEISTQSVNSIAPETVKPIVVKYEYR